MTSIVEGLYPLALLIKEERGLGKDSSASLTQLNSLELQISHLDQKLSNHVLSFPVSPKELSEGLKLKMVYLFARAAMKQTWKLLECYANESTVKQRPILPGCRL